LTVEDDTVYGVFGDHRIRPNVEPQASLSRQVLWDELCHWIRQRYAWYYERFNG
jgi:sulfotransferase